MYKDEIAPSESNLYFLAIIKYTKWNFYRNRRFFLIGSFPFKFFLQNWTRIQTSKNIHSLIKSAKILAFCVNFQEKICALFMKSDGSTAHFKNERPWENSDFLISQTHTQSKHNGVKAFITCVSKFLVKLICVAS